MENGKRKKEKEKEKEQGKEKKKEKGKGKKRKKKCLYFTRKISVLVTLLLYTSSLPIWCFFFFDFSLAHIFFK